MMNEKGISPIIASILLIMIVISSVTVIYNITGSLLILPPVDISPYLEDLKIVNIGADNNNIYIHTINRGGVDVTVDMVYVEYPSGGVLAYFPVYYTIGVNESKTIVIPRNGLDLSKPLVFKLASKKGILSSSLEIVKNIVTPAIPSLFTFYPTTVNIIKGIYVEGTLPNSVMYIDGSYYVIKSEFPSENRSYYPNSFTVYSGSHINGSVLLLQSQDQQSMYFLSSPIDQISRIYNISQISIINGSLISGSIPDTYDWDDSRMTFSSQVVSYPYYPIDNMNFTYNGANWSGYVSELYPEISPSIVTTKSSGFVSANQRAITRTNDPNKTIHVVYSNGTYLGYSFSVNDGMDFIDQWFISSGTDYEIGYNPSIASDVNNNIHIAYQNTATSPTQIKYILFSYDKNYGGNPKTSTSYQIINSTTRWAAHFVAMDSKLYQIELYIRNASTTASRLFVEIRKIFSNGTPDLSPDGLIASTELFNIPNSFSWVIANINADLRKYNHFAIVLNTNGIFHWAYVNYSYIGSLGGWRFITNWTMFPTYHFCFRIPGWFGWTSNPPLLLHSVSSPTTIQRPAITTYPYLILQDQVQNYGDSGYFSIYGNIYAAQSFKPSSNTLRGIMLYLYRWGTPSDHLYIEIRKSNGSYPDMSSNGIIISGRIDFGRIYIEPQWYDCIFPYTVYLNTTETYWIVVYSIYSSSSNHWRWGYGMVNPYPNGLALSSNDGGNTWSEIPQADFAFRTYSSIDERPAVAWYYQAPTGANRLRVQFLRCIPNTDPTIRNNWMNHLGTSTSPFDLYRVTATAETRISITVQSNTNNIYVIFIRSNILFYSRIYNWNPDTGNWRAPTSASATQIASGVYLDELSSAPNPYDNSVVLATVSSTTGYSLVYYFTSNNTLVNISPAANMRYPTITCIADRIFVIYRRVTATSSDIAYRYYNGTWSGENIIYSGSYQLPNSIYKPLSSRIDFVFLYGANNILYGYIYPRDLIKKDGPLYDSQNGNPSGSSGGCLKFDIDDMYYDYSFYRLNITFYTNFTSPSSWQAAFASFAWKFELSPSYKYNYGNYSHVKLNSVKLILADFMGNDISILYNDDNGGIGWTGVSIGYLYRNGIPVSLNPNTNYTIKIVFDISCLEAYDLSHIIARIDDVGIVFSSYYTIFNAELKGNADTDDWNSIIIDMVSNVSITPANCIIRIYNFEINRYPNYGEEGYFEFIYNNVDEELRTFQITSGANSFRDAFGNWSIKITILSSSTGLNFSLNMLNFIPIINIHSISVEFYGTSDVLEWTSLLWNSTQAFSISSVNVTIQLYNYTTGAYQTSGFGYVNYISGPGFSYESISQSTSHRAEDFKDSAGNWKILITATKIGRKFYMMNDYLLLSPSVITKYELEANFTFTNINIGMIINMTYNITCIFTKSVNATFYIWDYSTSSWQLFYSYISIPNIPENIVINMEDSRYISSGTSKLRVYTFGEEEFEFKIDLMKLDVFGY
ncbi:MAG: hypothetical protein QE159_01445 [Candidatus Verstraetearchaeota archaeon]|nr:hypothetical protein [Candidatus Verstraetearchaeota archaeon]